MAKKETRPKIHYPIVYVDSVGKVPTSSYGVRPAGAIASNKLSVSAEFKQLSPKLEQNNKSKKLVSAMYGAVTIKVEQPNISQLKNNIRIGQNALSRAKSAFITKGVKLRTKKGIAIYQADPDDPKILIRNIDGKKEKGTFDNSSFKVIA